MENPPLTSDQISGIEQEGREEDEFTGEIGAKTLLCRQIRYLEGLNERLAQTINGYL